MILKISVINIFIRVKNFVNDNTVKNKRTDRKNSYTDGIIRKLFNLASSKNSKLKSRSEFFTVKTKLTFI